MTSNSPTATTAPIETLDRGPNAITRSTVVDVPAPEIFARLQDPRRHTELDGSGTVKDGVEGPGHLAAGDTFTVAMKMFGIPYKIKSQVIAFEQDRLIEWRHPAGHTWRWELEPVSGTRTRVTETWNYEDSKSAWALKLIGQDKRNTKGIEASLAKLQSGFTTAA